MSKKGRKRRKNGRTQPKPWNRPEPTATKIKDAHYRCLKCGHEWKQTPTMVDCPKCRHLYIKWVNYNEDDWDVSLS
jgi:rubrerythrin